MSDDWLRSELEALEAAAPTDVPVLRRRRPVWRLGLAAGAGALVVLLVLVLPDLMRPTALEPGGTPSPSASGVPSPNSSTSASAAGTRSAEPTATPEPVPDPPTTDLEWTQTGRFPDENDLTLVNNLVPFRNGVVATGIRYEGGLPVFGPLPRRMPLVWVSADGRSWEPVAIGEEFRNADLGQVIPRPDGSMLAIGRRATEVDEAGRIDREEAAAWTSIDGVHWDEANSGLPPGLARVVHGPGGYVAIVPRPNRLRDADAPDQPDELWYSVDASSWELVHTYESSEEPVSLGAGAEGFVAIARVAPDEHVILATANGRDWVRSSDVPAGAYLDVLPVGPDWILVTDDNREAHRGQTWFSANGLEWTAHGDVHLGELQLDGTDPVDRCPEYIRGVLSTEPWLIVATELQYPCSESGFVTHGTQYISVDGAAWMPLPFKAVATAIESRAGSTVNDALVVDGTLILAGEQDGGATFWVGQAP